MFVKTANIPFIVAKNIFSEFNIKNDESKSIIKAAATIIGLSHNRLRDILSYSSIRLWPGFRWNT